MDEQPCEHGIEAGEKCGDCAVEVIQGPQPLGGATSFTAADEYAEADRREGNIREQEWLFEMIVRNIMADEEMTLNQKASSVERAGRELGQRIQNDISIKERGILDKVKNLFSPKSDPLAGGGEKERVPVDGMDGAFFVTKDTDRNLRWVALNTNHFYDREKEVFPEHAHKAYERYVDETKDYPELRLWHIPGTKIGQADFVTYTDGFMVTSGTFEKGMEDVAERLASYDGELGVSHGFVYPEKQFHEGVYNVYRTFEISPLPLNKAANTWTAFGVPWDQLSEEDKEARMLSPAKRKFLEEALGKERVDGLEDRLNSLDKELQEAGVAWKDVGEILDKPEESASKETPKAEDETPADKKSSDEKDPSSETSAASDDSKEEGVQSVAQLANQYTQLGIQLTEMIGKLDAQGKELEKSFKGIDDRLAELEKSDDEKVADNMNPRANVNGNGRPSQDDSTLVDDDKATAATKDQDEEGEKSVNPARPYVEDLVPQMRGQ